jgi:virginiamycin B lyase
MQYLLRSTLVGVMLVMPAFGLVFNEYPIPSRTIAGNVCTSPDNLYVYFTANTTIGRSDLVGNIQEFNVPLVGSLPMGLVGCTFGPDGTLYFGDQNSGRVYKFDPANQSFVSFGVPGPKAGMAGMVYHTDNMIYIMAPSGSQILRMKPDGTFLPTIVLTAGRFPHGPSSCGGNVWFAENTANRVAFITPAGLVQEFALPQANSKPFATACGSDNGVYFTENNVNKIGRIDMTSFVVKQWVIPSAASQPRGIAVSPTTVCFAEFARNKIGCMPLGGGVISESAVPIASSGPNKLILGPDGNYWFSVANVSYLMN